MQATAIPVKGEEQAKKKPPKLIEKVIEKVEEVLTSPASPEPTSQGKVKPKKPAQQIQPVKPQKQIPQQQQPAIPDPEQAQMQGAAGGSSEYVLPEGTTIKLPDGQEFETHAQSTISKSDPITSVSKRSTRGKKGGEI